MGTENMTPVTQAEFHHQSHVRYPAFSHKPTSLGWREFILPSVFSPSNAQAHLGQLQEQSRAGQIHLASQSGAQVLGSRTGVQEEFRQYSTSQ